MSTLTGVNSFSTISSLTSNAVSSVVADLARLNLFTKSADSELDLQEMFVITDLTRKEDFDLFVGQEPETMVQEPTFLESLIATLVEALKTEIGLFKQDIESTLKKLKGVAERAFSSSEVSLEMESLTKTELSDINDEAFVNIPLN